MVAPFLLLSQNLTIFSKVGVWVWVFFFHERQKWGRGCFCVSVLGELVATSSPCMVFEVMGGSWCWAWLWMNAGLSFEESSVPISVKISWKALMCLIVLDDILIITIRVPVILSVLSKSYDEKRAYNKKWLKMIVLNSHTMCLAQGPVLGLLAALPFHWSQGQCPAPLSES